MAQSPTAGKRDQPWLFRTYAGHSSATASNELYRTNLARGQTGLSVAFDLPTQTGYDSDHPLAGGEVGKVGVPITSLSDMATLFDGIPLEQMNTSMTINATAPWLLSLYIAVAQQQGGDVKKLQGTVQNDIIKEYLSRGTYIYPPKPSMRLITDVIAYTYGELPKWNPTNVCSYHLQEAGATPVQELAYALATAVAVLDAIRAGGQVPEADFGRAVGRISFFVNAGIRFVTELCKMRAFVELWDEICRERYGIAEEKYRLFRYGVQVNSLGLTEQQPENNVYRILLEMLAVTLSRNARARAVQLPAWNEALGLPRPWDQQWSLRMQQILALETDLLEYPDLFDGSKAVADKVAELKQEARDELARIDAMGGALAAVETGYMKSRLVESAAVRIGAIAAGSLKVVGVNSYTESAPSPLTTGEDGGFMAVDPRAEAEQIARLQAHRAARDAKAVAATLAELKSAAQEGRNVMPASIACAHAGVTTGEWAQSLREVFGEYRAPTGVAGARASATSGRVRPGARAGRAGHRPPRPPPQDAGRQARPRRPQQRCRADRRGRAQFRHRGRLRGHPPDPRPHRQRRPGGGRPHRRPLDPLRLAHAAGQGGPAPDARARHRRDPGRRRRHHPARGREGAAGRRRGARLHAEGLRDPGHHERSGGHRGGGYERAA